MPEEAEKQESQKTVVAFIVGLLIGGLLVWLFSSTPEQSPNVVEDSVDTEEVMTDDEVTTSDEPVVEEVGEGSIVVTNQAAGDSVLLGQVRYPVSAGWIVVRDYMDGVPGNILGAARFNLDDGLVPSSVELMRPTDTGSSYQVVFYTDDGETDFVLGEDVAIEGISATFSAQ